jgi:hypothetical protein
MFDSPVTRLFARAIVVGGLAGLAALKASIGDGLTVEENIDIISSFVVAAAAIGGVEYTTPLNALVGLNKRG